MSQIKTGTIYEMDYKRKTKNRQNRLSMAY